MKKLFYKSGWYCALLALMTALTVFFGLVSYGSGSSLIMTWLWYAVLLCVTTYVSMDEKPTIHRMCGHFVCVFLVVAGLKIAEVMLLGDLSGHFVVEQDYFAQYRVNWGFVALTEAVAIVMWTVAIGLCRLIMFKNQKQKPDIRRLILTVAVVFAVYMLLAFLQNDNIMNYFGWIMPANTSALWDSRFLQYGYNSDLGGLFICLAAAVKLAGVYTIALCFLASDWDKDETGADDCAATEN